MFSILLHLQKKLVLLSMQNPTFHGQFSRPWSNEVIFERRTGRMATRPLLLSMITSHTRFNSLLSSHAHSFSQRLLHTSVLNSLQSSHIHSFSQWWLHTPVLNSFLSSHTHSHSFSQWLLHTPVLNQLGSPHAHSFPNLTPSDWHFFGQSTERPRHSLQITNLV